jgi:hypothetical protein
MATKSYLMGTSSVNGGKLGLTLPNLTYKKKKTVLLRDHAKSIEINERSYIHSISSIMWRTDPLLGRDYEYSRCYAIGG